MNERDNRSEGIYIIDETDNLPQFGCRTLFIGIGFGSVIGIILPFVLLGKQVAVFMAGSGLMALCGIPLMGALGGALIGGFTSIIIEAIKGRENHTGN